jgi:hypothetical protein
VLGLSLVLVLLRVVTKKRDDPSSLQNQKRIHICIFSRVARELGSRLVVPRTRVSCPVLYLLGVRSVKECLTVCGAACPGWSPTYGFSLRFEPKSRGWQIREDDPSFGAA